MLVDGALAKCRIEGYYLRGMAGEGSGYGQTPTAIPTANLATVRANNETEQTIRASNSSVADAC